MYGGPTPKRHVAYSNSAAIAKLDLGRLQGWTKKVKALEAKGIPRVQTVIKYYDKQGRLRYKGCKALKHSESDTYLFITGHIKFRYMENTSQHRSGCTAGSLHEPQTCNVLFPGTIQPALVKSLCPSSRASYRTSSGCHHCQLRSRVRNRCLIL